METSVIERALQEAYAISPELLQLLHVLKLIFMNCGLHLIYFHIIKWTDPETLLTCFVKILTDSMNLQTSFFACCTHFSWFVLWWKWILKFTPHNVLCNTQLVFCWLWFWVWIWQNYNGMNDRAVLTGYQPSKFFFFFFTSAVIVWVVRTNKILLKQYECPVIAHVQIHILAGGERCYSKFRNCMAPTLTVGLSLYCMHPSTCTITCIFYLTLQSVVSSNILV